jgi:predicted amidophosphoribosyltransferase
MQRIRGGVCSICSERSFSSHALSQDQDEDEGAPLCGLCRRIEPPFVRATAYGIYDGGLRELIHLLMYASVRPAANVLGRMLAEAIDERERDFLGGRIAVVSVPLHRTKLRQREFNHVELIARAAMKKVCASGRLHLCGGALERRRETPSQTGLTSHQRRETVRGAFGVLQREGVKGREVFNSGRCLHYWCHSIGMCAGSAAGWCDQSAGADRRAYAEGFRAAFEIRIPATRLLGRNRLPPRFRWLVRRGVSLRGVRSSLVASNWNKR